jgi:hypothetical protein
MLHFLQQFWILADFRRGMLYWMQDFSRLAYPAKSENDRCCQPENLRLTFLCEDSKCWRQAADPEH